MRRVRSHWHAFSGPGSDRDHVPLPLPRRDPAGHGPELDPPDVAFAVNCARTAATTAAWPDDLEGSCAPGPGRAILRAYVPVQDADMRPIFRRV